jgi:predicted HicB family RNase H-like nuclease
MASLTASGKLLLRIPKSLHRRLAEKADRENVSLNQYIVSLLSRVTIGLGVRSL